MKSSYVKPMLVVFELLLVWFFLRVALSIDVAWASFKTQTLTHTMWGGACCAKYLERLELEHNLRTQNLLIEPNIRL